MTRNYAPYIWKITGFQAVHNRAVTGEQEVILSEPFYLSKNGYKLRIKLMPNGGSSTDLDVNNNAKGRFLSVYIKVIPGEYDSVLPWPFKEKICVALIDQEASQGKRVNISRVVNFEAFQGYHRPLSEPENGLGFPDFVHQSVLKTQSYLKNNTIFIMVSEA